MEYSVFTDKSSPPTAADLADTLGRAASLWDQLVDWLEAEFDPVTVEWKYGGQKYGWSLRFGRKKRMILYMTPLQRRFRIGTVLGAKAFEAVTASTLPKPLVDQILTAKKYAEGHPAYLEVKTNKDLAAAQRLTTLKMTN